MKKIPISASANMSSIMESSRRCSTLLTLVIGSVLVSPLVTAVHLDINATLFNKTEFAVSSFVETNINRADDGGLYAELIQNRAFQEKNEYLALPGWTKIGAPALFVDPDTPMGAIGHSLNMYISANRSRAPGERAGIANTGWYGLPIRAQSYNISFWAKRDSTSKLTGDIELSLMSLIDNKTYASINFSTSKVTTEWKQFSATLQPKEDAPDSNNILTLTMEVPTENAQHAWFNLVSLFPPTYKNRPNGLRVDLAEALADLKPKYVRIPGGCNLQGYSIPTRFNWTNSLGALQDRPGRPGYWVGYNTDGLGLKELLDMVEDFGATPILGVFDGYAASDESIPNTSMLDKYIQSAVDELDFVLADAKTNKWGRLRAELGHPKPYELHYVEIGNEDWTSTTYDYRWQRFYDALKKAHPNVTYIASATLEGVDFPAVDVHDFSGPQFFYDGFSRFDNWPRNGTKIFELENAVINTNSDDPFGAQATRFQTPTLEGSIAESIFFMGMQRNGDLVVSTSYAPYLAHNNSRQWTPNMINFNASHISLSTSYHVHRIFSHARADKTHAVSTDAAFGPLYWTATSTNASSTFFLHLANTDSAAVPVTGTIHGALPRNATATHQLVAEATLVAAAPGQPANVTNNLETPDAVVPTTMPVAIHPDGEDLTFSVTVPGWSYGVYRFSV